MKKWLKRIAIGIAALVVIAVAIGSLYEAMMRRRAATQFPPPGRLVDIGGRRIHLDCRGSGAPVVVLESGLDMNGSLAWALVHDSIAQTTRTCGYSRAGVMWSDDKEGPHNGATVATDLKKTLDGAGEPGPYVMVGHSLGGPYIMTFTKQYGAEVAGLVFVDASHPDQQRRFKEVLGEQPEPPLGLMKFGAALSWSGLTRLMMPTDTSAKVPEATHRAAAAYAPTSLGPMLAEAEVLTETLTEAGTFRALGNRPLIVLTAMAPMDSTARKAMKLSPEQGAAFQAAWKAMHDEEASWSSRSEHLVVPDATHYIQIDRPDLVIAAVRRVVGMVRAPSADSTATAKE